MSTAKGMQTISLSACAIGSLLMYKALKIPLSAKCELVLRIHFPDPPAVDLSFPTRGLRVNGYCVTIHAAECSYSSSYAKNNQRSKRYYDGAYLTESFFFPALAAVLSLRNHRRIRLFLNTVLRGVLTADNWARNDNLRSYHAENASNTIALSPMSPESGKPPAKDLRRRGLKKHSSYPPQYKGRRSRKC